MSGLLPKRIEQVVVVAFVALALLARLLWPGDAPFISDEPQFLELGLRFSRTFDPLILGLTGQLGVAYGPFTSWFFGALFLITHDLTIILFLKSLVVSGATTLAVFWLVKNLEFARPLYVLPVVASLFLYIDTRLLWDLNVMNCAVALAAYVSFIAHERYWSLFLAALMLALATLTHLMCSPLLVAIVLHFCVFKLGWAKKHVPRLLILGAVVLLLAGPYYLYVLGAPRVGSQLKLAFEGLAYPLLGARLFTTFDFSYFVGARWQAFAALPAAVNYLLFALAAITWLAYPVYWFGIFRAVRALIGERWLSASKRPELTAEQQVLLIALVTLVFHTVIMVLTRPRAHPHYYNGVWPAILLLFWYGLDGLRHRPAFRPVYFAYVGVLGFFLYKVAIDLHLNQGTRTLHYGPTLANQIEVVRAIKKVENVDAIELEAMHPKKFPHTFAFIASLEPASDSDRTIRVQRARVKYASMDPSQGRIELAVGP